MRTRPHNFDALCIAFQYMATRTWHRIHNNHTTPIAIREDGITALNLQDLYQLRSREFTVFDFSPHVESWNTGADWEWWFMQPGKNFGAAVQAKTLSPAQDYAIAYRSGRSRYPQICRLRDYSKAKGLTPMYCFYNWWPVPPIKHWPCDSIIKQEDLWGCALADGHNVWRLHQQQRYSLKDLHPYTMPWHCIVCCPAHGLGSPVGPGTRAVGIAKFLRQQRPNGELPESSHDQDDYHEWPEPQLVKKLPERIKELLRFKQSHKRIESEMIFKFFGKTPPRWVILQGTPEKEQRRTEPKGR